MSSGYQKVSGIAALVLVLCLFIPGFSQDYSYRHYTVEDGMVQNQVINLYQDQTGYLWIATKGGVSRFDGYEFKNYSVNDGLLSNQVKRIFEDAEGGINFFSFAGISRLYNGEIQTTLLTDTLPKDGKIYILENYTQNDVCIFNYHKYFIHYACCDSMQIKRFYDLAHWNFSTITYDELHDCFWFRTDQGQLVVSFPDTNIRYYGHSRGSFVQNRKGEVFAYDGKNMIRVNYSTKKFELISTGYDLENGIIEAVDPENRFYLRADLKHYAILHDGLMEMIPTHFNYINKLLIDKESGLWIGTETGLYRQVGDAFQNFDVQSGVNEYVWSIVEDDSGNIWFASYGDGLGVWDGKHYQRISDYRNVYNAMDGNFFYTGAIKASDGNLYFPVRQDGVLKYNGNNFSMVQGLPEGSVLDVFEDIKNQRFLFASTAGLVILEKNRKPIIYKNQSPNQSRMIKTIEQDKTGKYWLGGEYVLQTFDGNRFTDIILGDQQYEPGVVTIYKDHHENLWFGTFAGLYFYDYDRFSRIAPKQLKSQVSSMVEYDSSKLMIGISEGLAVLDLNQFYDSAGKIELEIFDQSKGFLGFDCIRNGILCDSRGIIWVATSERVVRFDPLKLHEDSLAPAVVFDHFISSGKEKRQIHQLFQPHSTVRDSMFSFPYFLRDFRFNFHAVHFYGSGKIVYSTMLEGYDNAWSEPTRERTAIYTNLAPGKYRFHVKARNMDGHWSQEPASISFSIKPAFWQTLSFGVGLNILIIIVVMAGIWLWMQKRKKQLLRKEQTERELNELQLKTIRSQMDPHFTFNALNTISSVIYKEDKEKAYRYFSKFAKLVRNSLEVSDKISRKLEEEIEFTKNYLDLEKIRFQDDFEYFLQAEGQVNMQQLVPKMIIQSYAENAVKHGLKHKSKNRKLWITIESQDQSLKIIVKDNGIGRKEAADMDYFSTGKGLHIMQNIFDLYNKLYKKQITQRIEDLYLEDGTPAGTLVELIIPGTEKKV